MTARDEPRAEGRRAVRRSPFEQRIYSPQIIAAVVAELVAEGTPAAVALDGTGLSEQELAIYTTKVSYQQIEAVIGNALRQSSAPAIALRSGLRMHVTAYGMYGYALLSSPTYKEALKFSERYIRVHGPLCDIAIMSEGAQVVYRLDAIHWPDPANELHGFALEFALAAHLTTYRDVVGSDFGFTSVAVDYPAPEHAGEYDRLFGCPVAFAQGKNEYRYDLAWADGSAALADERTYTMARAMCEQLLGEVNGAGGVAAQVRRSLIEQPGRYPSIEAMAEQLKIHPRALRRRLEAEGTSYRDLLGEVRMRLAIEYLRKTQMTNEEIANRLGYSDAANFRHAFARWTGKSPSDFRNGENG